MWKESFKKYYQQIYNEIFDRPYLWNKIYEDEDYISYKFTTNNNIIFRVEFQFLDQNEDIDSVYQIYEIGFIDDKNRVKITGEGDAYKIFATVLEIIESFISSKSMELKDEGFNQLRLLLTTEEKSRFKLYNRISKVYERRGYKIDIDKFSGNFTIIINI